MAERAPFWPGRRSARRPAPAGRPLLVLAADLGRSLVKRALALVQPGGNGLRAGAFPCRAAAPGRPAEVLPALEVAAQLADLVLDGPDLVFHLAAALGGLLRGQLRSGDDRCRLDSARVRICSAARPASAALAAATAGSAAGEALAVPATLAALDTPGGAVPAGTLGARGSAKYDDEREHRSEQPDHHERECNFAAHSHPFPLIRSRFPGTARAIPGVMPWREGYCTRARATIHAGSLASAAGRGRALYEVLSMIIRAARSNTSLPRG